MHLSGFCPRCGASIAQDRFATGYAICECGWTDNGPIKKFVNKQERNTAGIMAVIYVVIIVLFGHFVNWGSHALSAPALKIGALLGTNNKADYEELAQACISLDKFDCAKSAYSNIYTKLGNLEGLALLGDLQTRMGNVDSASQTYAFYFQRGGNDGEVQLAYAKVLELKGMTEDAIKYYESSIEARPQTLPIQATSGIVRIQVKHGQYEEAYERILAFHDSAENAKGYLNTELIQLEEKLGDKAKDIAKKFARKDRVASVR